jgi:vacuolar-type H+-ATPase subunit I/STV1
MKETDDTSRFTIRGGDEEESTSDAIFVSDAENLRIEKLSTRITLVAVLIPCVLVIILGVAYLDIKNRVVSTQSTGSLGVQNLSRDLESRFSSLSLKQAKLEEKLAENTKGFETATAALQVNLKKAIAELKKNADAKVDRSAMNASLKKSEKAITDLQNELAALDETFDKFDEELAGQIALVAEGMSKGQDRLSVIEKEAQRLDAQKVGKEALNLSLGLERLAIQELVKEKIRALEDKLDAMDKKIDTLNGRLEALAKRKTPSSPPASTAPAPTIKSPPPPPSPAPSESSTIEEQTID